MESFVPKKRLNDSSSLLLQQAIESGITSPKELANLMGNADVETWGFTRMHESYRYSSAKAIIGAVQSASSRFSIAEIELAVKSQDPKEIFKVMYENRKDLGNTEPGDGYKYHGRGYLQFTGRYNYTEYGKKFGVDLANNLEIAAEPEMAAKLAIAKWTHEVPKHLRENVRESAKIINGGTNGMEARIQRSKEWEAVITPELILEMQEKTNNKQQLDEKVTSKSPDTIGISEGISAILSENTQQKTETQASINDISPKHQQFVQQCEDKLIEECNKRNLIADSPQDYKNIAAAVAAKGITEQGMDKVEKATIEGLNFYIGSYSPHTKIASVNVYEAVNIPVHESMEKIQQSEQQIMQKKQERQMVQEQNQGRNVV